MVQVLGRCVIVILFGFILEIIIKKNGNNADYSSL